MSNLTYTENHFVERSAIGLFADLDWKMMSGREKSFSQLHVASLLKGNNSVTILSRAN